MELTKLRYFRAAAKLGNFTRAAESLFIAQPTLSKGIAQLEDELGVALFDREGNHVHLNHYGELFLSYTENILAQLEESVLAISDLATGANGSVAIAATQPEMLEPIITDFLKKHPTIHMTLERGTATQMKELLENRKIDFAVSILPIESAMIRWIPFFTERFGVLVSKRHWLAGRTSVHLKELSEEVFLFNDSNEDFEQSYYSFCNLAGFVPNVLFGGEYPKMIGELVSLDHGVTILSEYRHEQNAKTYHDDFQSDLCYIPISQPLCERVTGISYLKNRSLTKTSQQFIRVLLSSFSGKGPEQSELA